MISAGVAGKAPLWYLVAGLALDIWVADAGMMPVWMLSDLVTAAMPFLLAPMPPRPAHARVYALLFPLTLGGKCLLGPSSGLFVRILIPLSGALLLALGLWRSRQRPPEREETVRVAPDPLLERIQDYMEKEKPFLRGDLSMDDLAHAVFTNRLYLSRVINRLCGHNFRRFVNYYRIRHAVMTFDWKNPEKMEDLSARCGFNSHVSFNGAFKLILGESPSVWFSAGCQPFPTPEEYFGRCRRESLSRKEEAEPPG